MSQCKKNKNKICDSKSRIQYFFPFWFSVVKCDPDFFFEIQLSCLSSIFCAIFSSLHFFPCVFFCLLQQRMMGVWRWLWVIRHTWCWWYPASCRFRSGIQSSTRVPAPPSKTPSLTNSQRRRESKNDFQILEVLLLSI